MSTTSSFSALGVGSGIDFQSMIDGLVKIEGRQQTLIQRQITAHQQKVTAYQSLNSSFASIRSAAEALSLSTFWKAKTASSSSPNVSVSASSSAVAGTFSFSVQRLATAQVSASLGWVSSADTVIGTGNLLVGQGGSIGLRSVKGTGLSTGTHTFEVTQASSGASVSGSVLGDSITLDGSEQLQATVDGAAKTYTLAAGTYTRQSLADMIKTATNGELTGTVNSNGSLGISTTHEGSAASLAITGGSALAKLGLAASVTVNGTNGVIKVDGVANTVTSIKPDGSNTVTLNSSAGTVDATFMSGLRVGKSDMKNIDLGNGKLSSVAAAINNANAGVTAAVVQVGAGQYKLQLQSSRTGTDGAISTDFSAFSAVFGDISTVAQAQNALLQVGSGASAYSITSSSNTVAEVMPGVTLSLKNANPSETVTVSVNGDTDALSGKVKSLVDALNSTLSMIKSNSTFDPKTRVAGVFLGNSTAQSLQRGIFSTVSQTFPSSTLNALSNVGIKANSSGGFDFDEAKFKTAYAADPNAVASLFADGGTTGQTTGNLGFAEQVVALAKRATDAVSGTITTAIKGENSTIADLNKQVDRWTDRLAEYRTRLTRQFAAVDTAISNFKSQQSWLAGQIANLPKSY